MAQQAPGPRPSLVPMAQRVERNVAATAQWLERAMTAPRREPALLAKAKPARVIRAQQRKSKWMTAAKQRRPMTSAHWSARAAMGSLEPAESVTEASGSTRRQQDAGSG